MDRKTFLAATPLPFLAHAERATPERDAVTISIVAGNRESIYTFYIDEHSTNLMGMWKAVCVAAEGEYVSRVVLPRERA